MSAGHIVLTVWGIIVGLIAIVFAINYYRNNKRFVQCSGKEKRPAGYYICCVREAGHKGKHQSLAGREF